MLIYSSAAKIKGNNDRQIAQAIITGFTGQLQGWWDFYLSKEAKNKILNSSIVDINGREESDAVNTLIYTILSNFIGANELQLDRSQEQLMNLRCPTLSEFRWYKDVFMTKVLTRNDCNANFWKEKFISGLPVFFAERVKNRLKSKSTTNSIDWSILTYGDLSAEITAEGITLCNDIKYPSHNEDSTIPIKESSNLLCLWSRTKIKAEVFRPNLVRGFKPTCIIPRCINLVIPRRNP